MRFIPLQLGDHPAARDMPPGWVAASEPFTFVITEHKPGLFAASVADMSPKPDVVVWPVERINLGAEFTTFAAAEEACSQFLRSKRQ